MPGSQSVRNTNSASWSPAPATNRPVIFGTGLITLDVILNADTPEQGVLAAGGTCGNVLTALSYLGWDAYPVARLNGDAASVLVQDDLRRWGVELKFATQEPSAPTPVIVQTIDRDKHGRPSHRWSLRCPACRSWLPSFRPVTGKAARTLLDALADTKPPGFAPQVFFFDRVSRGAIILAEAFAAQGALVVFEPSGVGDPKLFSEALAVAHVLKYSHERLPDLATTGPSSRRRLLEIETRGAAGLHYRSRLLRSGSWYSLEAIPAPKVVDTAGAGDWCTAGALTRLSVAGSAGLADVGAEALRDGIRFGQAVAAMACGYEGARGVMDALSRSKFARDAAALMATKTAPKPRRPRVAHRGIFSTPPLPLMAAVCPACG
jgi:fructokinase